MIRRQQEERIEAEVNRVSGGVPDDRRARLRAIELAETHPEFFGRTDFAGAMRRAEGGEKIGPIAIAAERDRAMQAQRMAEKEIATASEKEQERIKKDILGRVADQKRRQTEWEHGVARQSTMLDQMDAEEIRLKEQGAKERAAADMKEAADKKRAAEKRAREAAKAADPSNQLRAMEEAVKDQVMRAAMANAPADFNPQMVGEWVRQALQDLPQNMNNVPMALQQALGEVRMHIRHQAELQNQQWNKMGGMQFNQPTNFPRG